MASFMAWPSNRDRPGPSPPRVIAGVVRQARAGLLCRSGVDKRGAAVASAPFEGVGGAARRILAVAPREPCPTRASDIEPTL